MPEKKIVYLHGNDLLTFPTWARQVSTITKNRAHLLPKEAHELRALQAAGRIIIAIDRFADDQVVGCIALWHLVTDRDQISWSELGTVFVVPGYTFRDSSLHIADELYRRMLAAFPNENIIATTTNTKALHSGQRAGLMHPGFHRLPMIVQEATCVCPREKTGADDPANCTLRDRTCFVRVSPDTMRRMGSPPDLPFPVLP